MYINTKFIQIILAIDNDPIKIEHMARYCVGGILIYNNILVAMAKKCVMSKNHDGDVLKVELRALDNTCYKSLLP